MKVHQINFKGRIPSKKNSRNIFVSKTGRRMNIPSKKYLEWHEVATLEAEGQFFAVDKVQEVQMEFLMPDKRRCDLTNKAESIMDLLVDVGMLEDDSWQFVPKIYLSCAGVDKKNPGVKVWIKYEG